MIIIIMISLFSHLFEYFVSFLRFANPAEALGSRHPEAQRRGGLEVWRLQCDGLDKFLHVVDAVP